MVAFVGSSLLWILLHITDLVADVYTVLYYMCMYVVLL